MNKYRSVIAENDADLNGTRADAKSAYTEQEKRKWWKRRQTLDTDLTEVLAEIESSCLGCWKGLLLGQLKGDPHLAGLEYAEQLAQVIPPDLMEATKL